MKKRLIYLLSILVVNVIIYLAMTLTFVTSLFRDDQVLALAPAVLVLPAIILQPWCVAFFFSIGDGPILASLVSTAVTVIVYGLLNRAGLLDGPKRFILRLDIRKGGMVAAGFFALVGVTAYARYVDFPTSHRGVLPPGINVNGMTIADSRYFSIGRFRDSEWLWRARISQPDLDRFTAKYDLRPLNTRELPSAFWRMEPYWWHPLINDRTKVFSTPSFPADERRQDGWFALAAWNPDDQVLHVWIKND